MKFIIIFVLFSVSLCKVTLAGPKRNYNTFIAESSTLSSTNEVEQFCDESSATQHQMDPDISQEIAQFVKFMSSEETQSYAIGKISFFLKEALYVQNSPQFRSDSKNFAKLMIPFLTVHQEILEKKVFDKHQTIQVLTQLYSWHLKLCANIPSLFTMDLTQL